MPVESVEQLVARAVEPTYSAREAAALLGRSFSWLDQRLRREEFVLSDGAVVQPLRTRGGYRRFTVEMIKNIALCSCQEGWFSMTKLRSTLTELAAVAYRDTGGHGLPG